MGGCPVCEGDAWIDCPGWEMRLGGGPDDARFFVFDQKGLIVPTTVTPVDETVRILQVDRIRPGQEFFLGFSDSDGNQYSDRFSIGVDLNSIGDTPR